MRIWESYDGVVNMAGRRGIVGKSAIRLHMSATLLRRLLNAKSKGFFLIAMVLGNGHQKR